MLARHLLTLVRAWQWTSEDDLRNIAKEAQVADMIKEVVFNEHRGNGKSKG